MRILDRYILGSFIKNYIISVVVLIGLYVVLDMVINFDEVIAIKDRAGASGVEGILQTISGVLDYYFYQVFLIFAQLSGIIPVAAAAFTMIRMSRFNELTAWLAAGIPMLRIASPVILTAVLLNGLLIIDQEIIIPQMAPKLARSHTEMHEDFTRSYSISGLQDENNAILLASEYTPPTNETPAMMREVDIIQRDENYQVIGHIIAAKAQWMPEKRAWSLENATRSTGLGRDSGLPGVQKVQEFPTSITPLEIALLHSASNVQYLSTSTINAMLDRPKTYGQNMLLRTKHFRFTQPIMNVILLLLAIPAVLVHDPSQLKSAAFRCLMLVGLAMTCVFVAQQIAGRPPVGSSLAAVWPALLAWIPIIFFAPISFYMLDRVRT